MKKCVIGILLGLFVLTGCIELQRALDPQNVPVVTEEPDYGPAVDPDDADTDTEADPDDSDTDDIEDSDID